MNYWIRLTKAGDVVLASFLETKGGKIPKGGKWVNVTLCITNSYSDSITTNDNLYHRGFKYFVKTSHSGLPIVGSLIASKSKPKVGHWIDITPCIIGITPPSNRAHSSGFSNGFS